MEITLMTINRIEETLVRLEERALELTMASPSPLLLQEHAIVHAEAKALRPFMDQLGAEYVQRLDRVQINLMCIRHRCGNLGPKPSFRAA